MCGREYLCVCVCVMRVCVTRVCVTRVCGWLSENANMYVYERYVFMNACLSFARVQLSCDHAFLPVFPTDLTSELYESTSLPNMCIMSSNHG